jgi:hypothetical protein
MDNREAQRKFSGPHFCIHFLLFSIYHLKNSELPPAMWPGTTNISVWQLPSNFTQQTGTPALSIIIVNWPTPKVSPPPYYQPHCYRLFKNCGTLSIHNINKKF